jgi:predicted nucleic acid-binding protein
MIIVDSTVIIDIWRGRPNVKSVLKPYSNQTICISAITLAEIYDGLGYTKEKKVRKFFFKSKTK